MEPIKQYFLKNFESSFVLLILVSVAVINYFIPYKLAFLNFYFIPILLAASYLDVRKSILGAFFCILLVAIYAYLYPQSFMISWTLLDLAMNITVWGGFLILTGALVGNLRRKLREEMTQRTTLQQELIESKVELDQMSRDLQDHSEHLEEKVSERTEYLEKAKRHIEELKERVEEALYSSMDSSVVKLIIEKRLRTEKRVLSVMFADLKGFTQYSEERRPEVVVTDLNRFLGEMESVLLSYRAHIDKYLGDGLMAEFGAPIGYERHALLAVMAGLKMQESVVKSGFPWQMRVGIATGEPIIGLIGHKRQSYTALGDVVNLANRIQEICVPGSVTVDEATFNDVQNIVDGKRKTIQLFGGVEDPKLAKEIDECIELLDQHPDNLDLIKKIGTLLLKGNDPVNAQEYLKQALQKDPNDDRIKLAFAESSVKMLQAEAISLRGKKARQHLYEIVGIKDPLKNRDKIAQTLYDAYGGRVRNLVAYPEDLILPVECLDGSVGHSKVVGFLTFAIADKMNLPDKEKQDMLLAGYLGDIGKVIIPHHLLNRAGALSKEEYEEVTKHCREGVRILKKMGYQSELLFEIITSHHENFNGSGYPSGLSGEEIPLGARIVAVADTYDALTSWRPYRDRWDYRAVFSEMQRYTANGKFDPKIMEPLGKLLGIYP